MSVKDSFPNIFKYYSRGNNLKQEKGKINVFRSNYK